MIIIIIVVVVVVVIKRVKKQFIITLKSLNSFKNNIILYIKEVSALSPKLNKK